MANDILYAYGFDGSKQQVAKEVDDIGGSDFDVVIVPFIHIHDDGSLYLNDTPVTDLGSWWGDAIAQLKSGFSVQKRVLVSIGGWDNANDWTLLGQDMPLVIGNLVDFTAANNIDGIDLDFEGGTDGYGETSKATVAGAARSFKEQVPDGIVTAPPYMDQDFWAGPGGVLAQAAGGGASPFDWWNVQFYVGDSNAAPDEYVTTFEAWATPIAGEGNGVADANAFVAPGCNGATFTPAQLSTGLADVRQAHPTVGGGFVWEYTSLQGPAADWASAIRSALG